MTSQSPGQRVIALHSGALGDVILFAQLLQSLRPPGGSVSLACGAGKARLLHKLGVIDEPIDFESLPLSEVFTDAPPAECTLARRLGRCDWLISAFGQGNRLAEQRLCELARASRCSFVPIRPAADYPRHLIELWAEQLNVPAPTPPLWTVPQDILLSAERAIALAGADPLGPFIAIHPGGGSPSKLWPLEAFEDLADRLNDPVLFILGPAELEQWEANRIDRLKRRHSVLIDPPLECLAGVLSLASAFLGNDSGPTHLAAAVGTPTLALFGPTNPAHFLPRGRRVRHIYLNPLASLSVQAVLQAVTDLPS